MPNEPLRKIVYNLYVCLSYIYTTYSSQLLKSSYCMVDDFLYTLLNANKRKAIKIRRKAKKYLFQLTEYYSLLSNEW